jgi:fumarate hydratase class I
MVEVRSLRLPLSPGDVEALRAGDVVSLNGRIATGRDSVHKYLFEKRPSPGEIPFDLSGSVLYHCGPVIRKRGKAYEAVAAGPTTSMRVEMYEPDIIRAYGLRGIMGKGGMGEKTGQALRENGCVYLHTIGGAAVYLARRIVRTLGVWKLEEFGQAEAMWFFEVGDFPAIVTMDVHGKDIHREVEETSQLRLSELFGA